MDAWTPNWIHFPSWCYMCNHIKREVVKIKKKSVTPKMVTVNLKLSNMSYMDYRLLKIKNPSPSKKITQKQIHKNI